MALDRDQALALLHKHVSSDHLIRHSLATEAIMRALAVKLGHDPDLWGRTGLLHDLDFDSTKDDMPNHTLVAEPILREAGLEEEAITAIKSHNAEVLGLERTTPLEIALTAAETMTGMVVAATLVYPEKKIAVVKPKSVTKRMKEKAFAAAVNRDHIRLCEKLGIPLDQFAALSVEAMKPIAEELGL